MKAIRGATTISSNNSDEIKANSIELMQKIIDENNLDLNSIVSIIFSCTCDITAAYPGAFIRQHYNLNNAAIMHFNEMFVEDSLKLCIRILIYVNSKDNEAFKFVYLREARSLRKDLLNDLN